MLFQGIDRHSSQEHRLALPPRKRLHRALSVDPEVSLRDCIALMHFQDLPAPDSRPASAACLDQLIAGKQAVVLLTTFIPVCTIVFLETVIRRIVYWLQVATVPRC